MFLHLKTNAFRSVSRLESRNAFAFLIFAIRTDERECYGKTESKTGRLCDGAGCWNHRAGIRWGRADGGTGNRAGHHSGKRNGSPDAVVDRDEEGCDYGFVPCGSIFLLYRISALEVCGLAVR